MSISVGGTISGSKDVLRQLMNVDGAIRKKALRKVVSSASARMAAAAKAGVPIRQSKTPANWDYEGKQLQRAIGKKVKAYPATGKAVGIVGARLGFRVQVGVLTRDSPSTSKRQQKAGDPVFVDPVKYLHLVTLGTSHSRAQNFLVAARDGTASTIAAESAQIVEEALRGAER